MERSHDLDNMTMIFELMRKQIHQPAEEIEPMPMPDIGNTPIADINE